jgi:hypothetical protein
VLYPTLVFREATKVTNASHGLSSSASEAKMAFDPEDKDALERLALEHLRATACDYEQAAHLPHVNRGCIFIPFSV